MLLGWWSQPLKDVESFAGAKLSGLVQEHMWNLSMQDAYKASCSQGELAWPRGWGWPSVRRPSDSHTLYSCLLGVTLGKTLSFPLGLGSDSIKSR